MGTPHICCRDPSMELDANFSKHQLHIFDYSKKGLDWTGTVKFISGICISKPNRSTT